MTLMMYKSIRPSIPSQEPCPSSFSPAVVRAAIAELAVEFMLAAFVKLWRTEETVFESIEAELTAGLLAMVTI